MRRLVDYAGPRILDRRRCGISAMIGATALFVTYWGFRFGVLGVYISGRTREKVCAATGQDAPGLLEKLAKAVAKKK
jgi:hypothetical protein